MELSARPTSPPEKCQRDCPFLSGSPLPSGKGFNPFLTLEPPLAPRKGYSDLPAHTSSPSPNPGKRCTDSPYPLVSSQGTCDPFSGLTCSPGISSKTGAPGSLLEPISFPPSQPPLGMASGFEPSSPLIGRQYCHEPILSGSPPPSPSFDRLKLMRSAPLHLQSPYCSLINSLRTPRPCPGNPYIDQNTSVNYSVDYPSAAVTSLVTYHPLAHRLPRASSGTSPPLNHVHLETSPMISPPVAHGPVESRPIISQPLSHRVLEKSQVSLYPPWSSGRTYNDPPLSSASPPAAGGFYQGCLKPPDSSESKPQFDPSFVKNYCGSPLSSQANAPGCSSSPQEGSNPASHLPPEAHRLTPGSPHCGIPLLPGITGFSCPSQSPAPRKPRCKTDGNSYLFSGATISGPPHPQEQSPPPSSHCPYSAFSYPSPVDNQFVSPLQSFLRKEPPLIVPVCPQVKSPKSPELKQPCSPHTCSVVTTAQNTSDPPKPSKVSASPPPPSRPSGLSDPSYMVTRITPCSNSCPQKLAQGTILPTLAPRTLKTVIPTSLPLRLPCDPVLPNVNAQNHLYGPPLGAPCSTHVYSVVPPTPDPCPLSGSTGPPQYHNQCVVPPCGSHGIPRSPFQPHHQPVGPPCSTHIYSFIPLRTPFEPQSLPIVPRPRGHPDAIPCGLHIYSVASQGSPKQPPQIPYSCPLPSSITSIDPCCSSIAIISECQSSDSQNKNTLQSRSQSQCENPHHLSRSYSKRKMLHLSSSQSQTRSPHQSRSQSRSNSPHQSISEDQSENLQQDKSQGLTKSEDKSQGLSKSDLHGQSRSRSKSPLHGKTQGKSKSPHHSKSQNRGLHHDKCHGQSKTPHRNQK